MAIGPHGAAVRLHVAIGLDSAVGDVDAVVIVVVVVVDSSASEKVAFPPLRGACE